MSRPPLAHLLGGLGTIAQSGLARAAVQNLWATVPIGIVAWMSIQKRRKAGTLSALGVMGDLAPVVMIVGTLVVVNHTLEEREKIKTAAKPAPYPVGTPITDAEFTPQPGVHPVIAFTEAAPPPAQAPPAAIPTALSVEETPYG